MTQLMKFFKTDIGISLIVAVGWQLIMTVIGVIITVSLTSVPANEAVLGHTMHWDANWYQHIILTAYGSEANPASPAFYPLFPLLAGGLSWLTFGLIGPAAAGLLINTAALWLALLALLRILKHFSVNKSGQTIGLALFLAFPSAFFMHVFYSEAVFIAIGFWAYLFALQRRWWATGLLLAILTAARLPSLLFVALCGLEFLRAYKWNIKKALNLQALWFLLAPVGLLLYGLYLFIVRGDFLAMFHAYSLTNDWSYQVFSLNIIGTIGDTITSILNKLTGGEFFYIDFTNQLLPLLTLALLITCSIYVLIRLKKDGMPLGVFGILAAVLFTLNSNVVSVHRYILPCIVIFVAITLFVKKGWRAIVLWLSIAGCTAIQLYLYTKFIIDAFAG